jgi:uncharacterized membrane protein YuzA (DUF378 family)
LRLKSNSKKEVKMRKNILDIIALILLIVGGLNWALVGLFNFDIVAAILGLLTIGSRIIYILVGIAAVYGIFKFFRRY